MADEPTPTTDPTPEPAPSTAPTDGELLTEIKQLRQTLADLPGKIVATITEDNERSIAEKVYDLFDSGGAFDPREPPKKEEPEVTPGGNPPKSTEPEPTPKKHGKLAGFASRFAGE